MSLSASVYSALLEFKIRELRFRNRNVGGRYLSEFCRAVGTGVVTETKILTGQIVSPSQSGSSSGIGILTIDAGRIADRIRDKVLELWQRSRGGELLYPFCLAIGETTVEHFALAQLTSDANGTAHFPAFIPAIPTMAELIRQQPFWAGRPYWIHMCTAIATGICEEVANNGTGTLTGATNPPTGSGVVDID